MRTYFLLSLIIIFTNTTSICQIPVSKMDECQFFDYLKILHNNELANADLAQLKQNDFLRSDMLKKLEKYLLVFGDDEIVPMYLEDENDKRACKKWVEDFKSYYNSPKVSIQEARDSVQNGKEIEILDLLIELCELKKDDNKNVKKWILEFNEPFALEYLYFKLELIYSRNGAGTEIFLPQIIKDDNLRIISERLTFLDNRKYTYYESYFSKPNFIKGFEAYHNNDFLVLYPGMNQDREMTGGFRFSLVTDYLKWRWVNIFGKSNAEKILSYQTINLVGEGYTPYIRYRNNFELADSLHRLDRPFASYFGISRTKNRIWRKGLFQHTGEFMVGSIGISQGRKIQAKLHEDINSGSQYVYGWDNQIANGGRLFLQLNHKASFLIWSNTNRYKTIGKPYTYLVDKPIKYSGFNLIGDIDLKIGSLVTSYGAGLKISSRDLLTQSGNFMINHNPKNRNLIGLKFDLGVNYKYVEHNSLLEGLGLFEPIPEDPYDKEPVDTYFLKRDEINRNIISLDFGVNIRVRQTTVFYRSNFHNLEYKSKFENVNFNNPWFLNRLNPKDVENYKTKTIKEQMDFTSLGKKFFGTTIYGFATLGISWLIN